MKVIYSSEHIHHNPPYEIYDGVKEKYAEKKERIESIVSYLQSNGYDISDANDFSVEHIRAVHQNEYQEFVQNRSNALHNNDVLYPSYFIMDTYTPLVAGTYNAARQAVNVALTGAQYVQDGEEVVYALSRPPGHHAEYNSMGGYCYFNNSAIAAEYLSKNGRVAILDIDFHHGNGTQHIFYDRSDVLYVSIHADPRYKFPYSSGFREERGRGEGIGYNINYPLPLDTSNISYKKTLKKALRDITIFQPDFLLVSAGFDTYENDPIGGLGLTIPFYQHIGQMIQSLDLPTLIVQEGGYHVDDLGKIAHSFLQGFKN